jgi:hypothetical protein
MAYKYTFTIDTNNQKLVIDAFAMNHINNIPTRFQIFVNGNMEGFMYYKDGWQIDRYSFSKNLLDEAQVQEVGDYLQLLYE